MRGKMVFSPFLPIGAYSSKRIVWSGFSWVILAILAVGCISSEKNTPPIDLLTANETGLTILRHSLTQHGGDFLEGSQGSFTIAVNNMHYIHPGQSLTPMPPFESYTWERQYFLSLDSILERSWFRQDVSGFVFENFHILKDGKGHEYDLVTKTYIQDDASRLYNLEVLPHTYLRTALKNPLSVIFLRKDVLKEKVVSVVQGRGTGLVEFWIDDASGLLSEVHTLASSAAFGAVHRKYSFDEYFQYEKLWLAGSVKYDLRTQVMDNVSNTFTVTKIETPQHFDDIRFPTGSCKPANFSDRPTATIQPLGDGIYLYQNITGVSSGHSYNVLFAEFSDHVLICEAPVDSKTTEDVIKTIREVVSNKPIRYVVQSHHHNDHLAGLRGYIARDVSIITTAANAPLIENIAKASFAHAPDAQTEQRALPKFEFVENEKLVKRDSDMTVEIYNVGPTDHTADMLAVYFPKQKILFQSDMILYKENPHTTPVSRQFAAWLSKSMLDVNVMVGAHGYALDRSEISLFKENKLPQH